MEVKIEQVGDEWQVRLKNKVQSFDLGMLLETYEEATWYTGQFRVMLEEYTDKVYDEGYQNGQDYRPGIVGEPL